jgi:hypothetical protein
MFLWEGLGNCAVVLLKKYGCAHASAVTAEVLTAVLGQVAC